MQSFPAPPSGIAVDRGLAYSAVCMQRDDSEEARRRYRYRKIIQRGDVRLPYRVAARLIGPDCAYHLYQHHRGGDLAPERRPPRPS